MLVLQAVPAECLVASSGWGGGRGGPRGLRSFVEYYGFRFVELYYSYARLPGGSLLELWGLVARRLGVRWSVLVPRSALERYRLDWRGRRVVARLVERVEEHLGGLVDWYVLRVPVNIDADGVLLERLGRLVDELGLEGRLAVEAPGWSLEALREVERLGAVAASTDSPTGLRLLPPRGGVVHLRLLGHRLWWRGPYPPRRLLRVLGLLRGVGGLERLYLVAATGRWSVEDAVTAWELLRRLGVCGSGPRRVPQFVEAKLDRLPGTGLDADEEE